jgi:hypothetical protein
MSIFHPNLKIPKPSHSSQIDVFKYFSALFYQILIAEIMLSILRFKEVKIVPKVVYLERHCSPRECVARRTLMDVHDFLRHSAKNHARPKKFH